MITLRRILCPVDFSEPSKRALRHALALARWHESELTVLHVEDILLHAASVEASGYRDLPERQYDELRDFIADAGGSDRNVRIHIDSGDAVSGILKHATRDASDLIVMGTHGRSGLARAVLGSVTERVVRQAAAPVLTIPPSAELREADGLMPFDPILCASDFSEACSKALDLAIVMGQEADARVILLHALQTPHVDVGITPMPFPTSGDSDMWEVRTDARARLRRGLPADAAFRCRPELVVMEGHAADAILETASREDVKLIVMGVQSRSAFGRLIFGSTTRRVMQSAACPVLSVRANQAAGSWPAWSRSHEVLSTTISAP
jgi:nucleotide-binding universal stress UspA family protein